MESYLQETQPIAFFSTFVSVAHTSSQDITNVRYTDVLTYQCLYRLWETCYAT